MRRTMGMLNRFLDARVPAGDYAAHSSHIEFQDFHSADVVRTGLAFSIPARTVVSVP